MTSPSPIAGLSLTAALKQRAVEIGFELVGVAPAVRAGTWEKLDEWLARGFAGEMQYIERRREAYQHPQHVLPQVRSVVMLGLVYGSGGPGRAVEPLREGVLAEAHVLTNVATGSAPRIARYAQGTRDYHEVIREKLKHLADALHELQPGCKTRGVVDTAPLLERDFARLAGLGWFGKNTLLLNKRLGSDLFLAALLTDCELEPDQPHETQHCGTCTRCLDVCPTGAFPEPYVLDATKCISYLTIETAGEIPEAQRALIGQHAWGCDICQDVCPFNFAAAITHDPAWQGPQRDRLSAAALWQMSDDELHALIKGSAMTYVPLSRLRRNLATIIGNSGDPSHAAVLDRPGKGVKNAARATLTPAVEDAVAWAKQQLGVRI